MRPRSHNSSTNNNSCLDLEILQNIHFLGSTLAPFFLHDPLFETQAVLPLLKELQKLDEQELAETWPFVSAENILPSAHLLIQGAQQPQGSELALDELANDYRQLFVDPALKRAPYWGSVYTDKDGVTFGQTTMQLQDWLAHNGITVSFGPSDEPEDSMGALLALLSWCAYEDPALIPDLLQLHILPWSSHFLEIVEDAAEHPFYQGLAGITRLSLEAAGQVFGLAVTTPRFYR